MFEGTKRFLVVVGLVIAIGVLGTPTLAFSAPYDFGGDTVAITMQFYGSAEDFASSNHMLFFLDMQPELALEYVKLVEEMFNVNIEFRPRPSNLVEQVITEALAGEAPDLVHLQTTPLYLLIAEGLLTPLDERLIKDKVHPIMANAVDSYSEFMGNHYAFAQTFPQGGTGVFWNKSLFEREGFPSLYDLYEAGEWTWEALTDLAVRATKDTTGDGEINQWGVSVWGNAFHRLVAWSLGSNEATVFEEEDGRLVFALDRPEAIETFDFVRSLYFDHEVVRNPETDFWRNMNVAMQFTNPRAINFREHLLAEQEDEIGFVPFPKGPNATEHKGPFADILSWAIPITTTHPPEALVELLFALVTYTEDYMQTPPYVNTDMDERIDRVFSQMALHVYDRESLDHFRYAYDHLDVYVQHHLVPGFTDLAQSIVINGEDPQQAISQLRPVVQANLDDIVGY